MSFTIDNWDQATQHDCDRANEALSSVVEYLCGGQDLTDARRDQLVKHAHDLVGNYYSQDLTVGEIINWATNK